MSLQELTIPETKARIIVNDETFDVYAGQTFYNGLCRLVSVQALGLGAGKATVRCGSTNFELDRQINKINLEGADSIGPFNLGDLIKTDTTSKYYLVYTNKIKDKDGSFVVIAKLNSGSNLAISEVMKTVARKKYNDPAKIDSVIKIGSEDVNLFALSENVANPGITFRGDVNTNGALGNSKDSFKKANDAYDFVNVNFGAESFNDKLSYGERALWSEYKLAETLGQKGTMIEVLSRIFNEYPQSVYDGKTAESLISGKNFLASNPEAKDYDVKQDIAVELVSATEPSEADASVSISYSYLESGKMKTDLKSNLMKGDVITVNDKSLTIESFDETSVKIRCGYTGTGTSTTGTEILTGEKGKPLNFGKNSCDMQVYVEKINLRRVAKVQITPLSYGRSRETNFTFSIGIEKRAFALNLTPEQADNKIADLNAQIGKYKNISEKLGKVIEGGKAACLATSAIINVKNLLSDRNGEASARTEVMKRWNVWCATPSNWGNKYQNSEECIAGEYDKIEPEITATAKAMDDYNTAYESLKNNNKLANGVVNDSAVKTELQKQIYNLGTGEQKNDITADNFAYLSYSEISQLYFNMKIIQDSSLDQSSKDSYNNEINNLLENAEKRKIEDGNLQNLGRNFGSAMALGGEKTQEARGSFQTWNDVSSKFNDASKSKITDVASKVAIYNYAEKGDYLAVLDASSSKGVYNVKEVYQMTLAGDNKYNLDSVTAGDKSVVAKFRFIEEDATSYKNPCSNCNFMKVFSLDPYKGQPALLPFDIENGFYVQVKNDFGTLAGNSKSYLDSGRVNSFYLCNVGKNKLMEEGLNDDTCRRFDFYTGDALDSYPGLTKTQAKSKVQEAISALNSAQIKLAANPSAKTITINGRSLNVQNSEGDSGSKCTDFMSPGDCQMIYNVCDPFVCPNSRCDLGGRYKVDNVIQSGIIGSTLLCLPNSILVPGNKDTGVVIPVCLTGINAGLQGWISILESYRDCINESVTTGRTVGVCDVMHSVYLCDFFWRQAGPISSAIVKNLFLGIFGKTDSGGGEYLFVNDAWNNAEKSAQFFQTAYAKDSKLTFGFDSVASTVVADVCKMPVSATYPDNFKTMLEPEIPVQFTATFEEISYSTATVPPTSQYNVFYHIYGGDSGHYYQVYLKSPSTAIGYIGKESVIVANGYISAGEKASETKNFIDTSGYKQLCVKIDAKEECGFKSVTTSFALDYAKDQAVSSQATDSVTSESECINGGQSLGAFLTPNIQQGVEEFINPELYNQGVIRVCSSANPGQGTEPTRWKDVGYCGEGSLRCWVDTKSVKKAIQGKGIENYTLSEIDKLNTQSLEADGFFGVTGADQVSNLESAYNNIVTQIKVIGGNEKTSTFIGIDYAGNSYSGRTLASLDNDVLELDKKLIYNKDRAELWLVKAKIYGDLAEKLKPVGKVVAAGGSAAPAASVPAGGSVKSVYSLQKDGTTLNYKILKNSVVTRFYILNSIVYYLAQVGDDRPGLDLLGADFPIFILTQNEEGKFFMKFSAAGNNRKKDIGSWNNDQEKIVTELQNSIVDLKNSSPTITLKSP
ncbi:MAG: hypothetical protein Q8L27_03195 [archaeon]|nr:hypothetical protein [archaeon]